MRAQLISLDGDQPIEVVKDLMLVGRKEECDLRLDHKSVSKMHCVIVKTDGLLLVRDLGSTNGTRVNGQRIRRAALLPNDELTIAGYRFKVSFGPGEPPPVSPEEHTQQLDAKEVIELIRPATAQPPEQAPARPDLPVQANPLPDVYPEDESSVK